MFRGRIANLKGCRDRIRLRIGDIRNPSVVAECAQGCDVIFHLAAQSNIIGSAQDTGYCFATNVEGTFNVLEAARTTGVGRVIFTSSREVYGDSQTLPLPEKRDAIVRRLADHRFRLD
jgi:UDP-glucose 4-epimerase